MKFANQIISYIFISIKVEVVIFLQSMLWFLAQKFITYNFLCPQQTIQLWQLAKAIAHRCCQKEKEIDKLSWKISEWFVIWKIFSELLLLQRFGVNKVNERCDVLVKASEYKGYSQIKTVFEQCTDFFDNRSTRNRQFHNDH